VVALLATETAHKPTSKEMISLSYGKRLVRLNVIWLATRDLTMWKASAINARECTAKPTPNSRRKKTVSRTSITLMRVDLDHPILGEREALFLVLSRRLKVGSRNAAGAKIFSVAMRRF
jgi:hypothetical protein